MLYLSVLLVLLISKVQVTCQLKPWKHMFTKEICDFTCKTGQYLAWDDSDVFTRPDLQSSYLAHSCGIPLKCTYDIANRERPRPTKSIFPKMTQVGHTKTKERAGIKCIRI